MFSTSVTVDRNPWKKTWDAKKVQHGWPRSARSLARTTAASAFETLAVAVAMAAAVSQSEIKLVENLMAERIAAMEATRPDIIRAAPASSALACCARPLRGFGGRSFFHYSRPISRTTRIKEFWSHSWHGPRWMVVMTVLLLNNSLAALVISTLVSFLLGLFYAMDRLPPLEGFIEFNGHTSGWSQWGGMVSYILVLFFWPNRKKIFLDLLCIDQTNESEKQDALLSMGAFLKRSDSLIVFWDPTYTRRLWCVFELAAYLHAHGGGLIILPTIAGPCFLCVTFSLGVFFILIGFVGDQDIQLFRAAVGVIACFCFYLTVSSFRKYFHSVKVCARELKQFQLHRTVNFCCLVGHRSPSGEPMLCDRQILRTCIERWFGSISSFESQVANAVGESLLSQLGRLVSYRRAVMVMIPLSWSTMDIYFAQIRYRLTDTDPRWLAEHHILRAGILELIRGLALWLGVGPFLLFLAVKMGHVFQKPRSSQILDCLLNICIVVSIAGTLVAILQVEMYFWGGWHFIDQNILAGADWMVLECGSFVFMMTLIIMSLCGFRCCLPRTVPVDEMTMPEGPVEAKPEDPSDLDLSDSMDDSHDSNVTPETQGPRVIEQSVSQEEPRTAVQSTIHLWCHITWFLHMNWNTMMVI